MSGPLESFPDLPDRWSGLGEPSRRLCSIRNRLRSKETEPRRFSAPFRVFGRTSEWFDAIDSWSGFRSDSQPGADQAH
ncbi:MAG: hypothetical protein CMJ27_05300 [Phycisphaerae bacterium]|nr:hypothetical protein [Phycisphaerae bacterium]